MRAKTSEDQANVFQRLFERGEHVVGDFAHDLLHGRGVPEGLAKVIEEATRTKGLVDQNVEALLHLLNLPSRTDYEKLAGKVERLQGSLVNLSMKLDRLLAGQSGAATARKPAGKKPRSKGQ